MLTPAEIAAATSEITQKSRTQIETETARKWAARACAAYAQYVTDRDTHWLADAVEYQHEAVEHAAGAEEAAGPGVTIGVLAAIRADVEAARKTALGW